MIKKVCVFASSCNYLEEIYYKSASELGELLAKNDFEMVYGGSCLGLMWACAEQVKNNNSKIYGVMPKKLYEMGVYTDECVDLTVTEGMRERKALMDELSDAVIALPGGFGTLEELAEMIVQKQLGYNQKPIIFLNTNGFYDKLIEFFDEMMLKKFARSDASNLYFIANSPNDAIKYLKNYKVADYKIGKAEIYNRD